MLKLLILAIGWLFVVPSYATDYYDNLYQECRDSDFTPQVIHTTRGYCTPSGYDWPACLFKPKQRDSLARCDDYIIKTPNLIENVIVANKIDKDYYRSQSSTNGIPPICFLASTALGRHQWNSNQGNYNPFEDAHLKNPQNFNSIICKTSQDLYSCLFYTFFNSRVTMKKLEQYLKEYPKVNSMKIGKKDYKIFDEDDFYFKWAFVIWSHNAGREIITEDFRDFVDNLVLTMNSHDTKCNKCNTGAEQEECASCVNKYIKYKKSILNNKPLSGKILIREFQKYATKYKVSNQDQVKNIITDIQKDLRAFTGRGKLLENAVKSLPKKPQPKDGLRRADLDEFLQDVQYHCPTRI